MTRTFLSALMATALLVGGLVAQDGAPRDPARDQDVDVDVQIAPDRETREPGARPDDLGQLDQKTGPKAIRASQLIGINVYNRAGESVGEVNDLVLDASGRVRYAALSVGGVLGIGDRMFAVPWQVFECVRDPDDANEFRLVLNVEEEALKNAPGFDRNKWPNLADERFTTEIDEYFLKFDRRTPRRGAVRLDRSSIEIDR
jgi:sporulation protein YlmC with PRC-barrel domain